MQGRHKKTKGKCLRYQKGTEGIQYGSFHKQQLLSISPHPLWAGFPFVSENRETRISGEGAGVTKCDLGAQPEGCDTKN